MDPKRLLFFLRLIEKIPIEYMVTGSIAAILYGKPRLTHDMDVVVIFPRHKIKSFCQHFAGEEFYSPLPETIEEEIKRGDLGHMNVIDNVSGFKIDLYPFKEDPLVQWGLEKRKRIEILPEETIWVAPPEYVILKKLCYYREGRSQKHLEDIRGMLEVTGDDIDKKTIERWAQKLNISPIWQKCLPEKS